PLRTPSPRPSLLGREHSVEISAVIRREPVVDRDRAVSSDVHVGRPELHLGVVDAGAGDVVVEHVGREEAALFKTLQRGAISAATRAAGRRGKSFPKRDIGSFPTEGFPGSIHVRIFRIATTLHAWLTEVRRARSCIEPASCTPSRTMLA